MPIQVLQCITLYLYILVPCFIRVVITTPVHNCQMLALTEYYRHGGAVMGWGLILYVQGRVEVSFVVFGRCCNGEVNLNRQKLDGKSCRSLFKGGVVGRCR